MEFVYCDHITSYAAIDPYVISPEDLSLPFRYSLGKDKMLLLCSRCTKALAYEMVTMFIIDSTPLERVRRFAP